MRTKDKLEVQMLNEARAEVIMADQKASVILAASGIGFGAVLGGLLSGDWKPNNYATPGQIFWWIGTAHALGVVLLSAIAIWPRFTTTNEDSLVSYWGHVARYSNLDAFEAALEASDEDRDRTRHQLWRIARIVRKKYCCVRWSLGLGGGAAAFFILAGIFG